MKDTDLWTLFVIVGLALVTMITRSFFFISSKPWSLPHWAQRGLQYAPIAAVAGVIAPEIFMRDGALLTTWMDARLYGAAAGAAWYFWRRHSPWATLGTIIVGMVVYLLLHLGLGW